MSISISLLADFKTIFPDSNQDLKLLIKSTPRNFLLKAATYFLAIDTLDNESIKLFDLSEKWISATNIHFKNELQKKARLSYGEKFKEIILISPITSLKLLQYALNKSENGNNSLVLNYEVNIILICLLINQEIVSRNKIDNDYILTKRQDLKLAYLLLSTGFSSSDLINFNLARELTCQTVKYSIFIGFLHKDLRFKEHLNTFLKYYSVDGPSKYLSNLYPFIEKIGLKEKIGFIEFKLDKTSPTYEADKQFIDKIAKQDFTDEVDVDFKNIRSNPLILVGDNHYRVSHPIFFTDKIFKSLFFDFLRINSEMKGTPHYLNEFKSVFAAEFSEKFLLYNVMKYCFANRFIQFTGHQISSMGVKSGPDYYIRNGKDIFFIENKDILIRASIKESGSLLEIEKELKKKFLEKENKKPTGIGQIITGVDKLLKTEYKFDTKYNSKKVFIYPILIVHDIVFDTPGLNLIFNEWFQIELGKLQERGLDTSRVKPLVLLSIDSLIRAADVLRLNKSSFKEMINKYYKNAFPSNNYKLTLEKAKEVFSSSCLPSTQIFEKWLAANYPYYVKHNEILSHFNEKLKNIESHLKDKP